MSRTPEWQRWADPLLGADDYRVALGWELLRPRETRYTQSELRTLMSYPPLRSLPPMLVPGRHPTMLPPRLCYGWPLLEDYLDVWAQADPRLQSWTQVLKQRKRGSRATESDESEEEWDPHCDDYVNYYVCAEDKWGTYANVVRDWAVRAKVQLPMANAPLARVMAHGKAFYFFVLYDNYHLEGRLSAKQIEDIRAAWSVNRWAAPEWYPVLPTLSEDFQWVPKSTTSP